MKMENGKRKVENNTWTIIKKEFARFFGDKQLLFTTVIMPGLLIYIIYSLMGSGIAKMETEGADEQVIVQVENLPQSIAPLMEEIPSTTIVEMPVLPGDIENLESKDFNGVLVRFPEGFDTLVATYNPQSGEAAPNVEIFYNSANNASSRVYHMLTGTLSAYEDQLSNRFDINRADTEEAQFDMASSDDVLGSILSKLIPMLILMLLFSGVMAIAPSSIAG
ncbi:MAG: ABC transporter permease, partial [Bacteroidales bacterium]|nr:ABC transporter permease [Bacteroidales bacterium]